MSRLFYCYSKRLKNALCANGFQVVDTGVNKNTGSVYWLFVGSDELNYYKDNIYQTERDKF